MGEIAWHQLPVGDKAAAALDQVDLTMRQFARLSGMFLSRVERMLQGAEGADIPHMVNVLLALLTLLGAMERAKAATDAMIVSEKG
jgi:transcriptional regulator with XRE-family HTH domain